MLDLTWDYPLVGPHDEPDAECILQEVSGRKADGSFLSSYDELERDGSTACGSWIHCGVYAAGVNQTARKKPGAECKHCADAACLRCARPASVWTGRFPRAGKAARPAAAAFGLPLCTYTAALVANTAVPVWHESHRWLPFVFGSGAALSAGAAGVIAAPPDHARPARRLALTSAVLEIGLKELMERRLGDHGEPYRQGAASKFGRAGQLCIATGAALLAARGGRSHGAAIAGGALLSAGALSARWSVFKAGFQSAANPKYVVRPQRGGIERGERRGAARQESYVRDPERALGSPATAPAELSAS